MKIFRDRNDMVKELVKPGSVGVEVGVWRAEFSVEILKSIPRKLYLVDAWENYPAYASDKFFSNGNHAENLKHTMDIVAPFGNQVSVIQGFSSEVALRYPFEPLDWVYLDANHTYPFTFIDLVAWSLRLAPNGIIMGHDYIHRDYENFGVIPAVNEFCQRFNWKIEYLAVENICSYALVRQ